MASFQPAAGSVGAINVRGLPELQRAFGRISKDLRGGVREALEAAGDPVRSRAAQLALSEISGMKRSRLPWYQMRVGVTARSIYVAPVQRGVKTKGRQRLRRPNLAPLLLEKALEPALEQNRDRVEREIFIQLDELFRVWERSQAA